LVTKFQKTEEEILYNFCGKFFVLSVGAVFHKNHYQSQEKFDKRGFYSMRFIDSCFRKAYR
jgi:hypothetical protein